MLNGGGWLACCMLSESVDGCDCGGALCALGGGGGS